MEAPDEISQLIVQLRSSALVVRLSTLSSISLNYFQDEELKVGPLKRIYRNLLLVALDGYYTEKLWIQKISEAILSSITFHTSGTTDQALNPFASFLESVVDVANQCGLYTRFDDFKSSMLLTISFSVLSQLDSELASDETSNKDTGVWCEIFAKLSSCCIGLKAVAWKSHHKSLKALHSLKTTRPDLYLALINALIQGTTPANLDNEVSALAVIALAIAAAPASTKQANPNGVDVDPEVAQFQDDLGTGTELSELGRVEVLIKQKLVDYLIKKGLQKKENSSSVVFQNVIAYGKYLCMGDWNSSSGLSEAPTPSSTTSSTAGGGSAGESLEATVLKKLKQAPEGNSGLILALLTSLGKIDLSNLVIQGANVAFLKMLKSSDELVQVNGLEIARLIPARCGNNAKAFAAWIETLVDSLVGKGGILSQAAQRIYIASAIAEAASFIHNFITAGAASAATSDSALIRTVESVLNCLPMMLDKEVDENGRTVISLAMSRWIVAAAAMGSSTALDKIATASFVPGLGKEKLKLTYLMALSLACIESEAVSVGFSTHCFALVLNIVKEALKKSVQFQPDSIFAWNCLVSMASKDAKLASQVDSLKSWEVVFSSPTSFLLSNAVSATLIQNFNSNEVSDFLGSSTFRHEEYQFKICPSFIPTHFNVAVANSILGSINATASSPACSRHVVNAISSSPQLMSFVLKFCCHSIKNVRVNSFTALDSIKAISISELYATIDAFTNFLCERADSSQTATASRLANFKGANFSTDEDAPAAGAASGVRFILPPDSRLIEIVESFCDPSCLKFNQVESFPQISKLLASIILQISHELVNSSLAKSISHLKYSMAPILVGIIGSIDDSEKLKSEVAFELKNRLLLPNNMMRKAVHSSIICLLSTSKECGEVWQSFASDVAQRFMKQIATSLQTADIVTAISEDDIEKVLNAEAIIEAIVAKEVSSAVDVKITNADRKKDAVKGKGPAIQDDDWADRVKQEKIAKIASDTAIASNEIRARVSGEIKAVSTRVNKIINETICSLNAVYYIIKSLPDLETVKLLACQFLPIVSVLSRCELAEQAGMKVIEVFANRILDESAKLISGKQDIISSIRIVSSLVDRPLRKNKAETQQSRISEINNRVAPLQRTLSLLYNHSRSLALHPSLSVLIFPIVRGILHVYSMTANPLPGCEHAFFIMNMIFPDAFFSISVSQNSNLRQCIQFLCFQHASLIEICLLLLSKFKATVQISPETLLMRMFTTRSMPLDQADWITMLSGSGALSSEQGTRLMVLRLIFTLFARSDGNFIDVSCDPLIVSKLWLLRFDENQNCQDLASQIWNILSRSLTPSFYADLIPFVCAEAVTESTTMSFSPESAAASCSVLRKFAAKAIAGGAKEFPERITQVISDLQALFMSFVPVLDESVKAKIAKLGAAGGGAKDDSDYYAQLKIINSRAQQADKKFPLRIGIALAFSAIANQESIPLEESHKKVVMDLLNFILMTGVVDPIVDVRNNMMEAGRALVDNYGGKGLGDEMLAYLQDLLGRTPSKDENLEAFDYRYEAGVVLLGAAGKHINLKGADDGSISKITDTLLDALNTPSEDIQIAVAESLAPLIQSIKANPAYADQVKAWIEKVMKRIVESESYGERRGAAFGLSALVKGLGIPSLKQFDIVNSLKESCSNGSVGARQGCLAAFECLSDRLGLLFEPYIITVIPVLLKSFSHGTDIVRSAAAQAATVIMNKLSAHGVKQILTPVMASFADPQWKTRQEAIRLLGSMAHCAPKQLGACLPQIIPKLVECSQNEHPRVKETAKESLNDISSVIKNPEISRLSPGLIAALVDPPQFTKTALNSLLECEFMHSIDATALAIVVPILFRALKDRTGDIKRKASAITGNMINMVGDPKVLAPYVPQLITGLKECLIDHTPDVRATSAKALGSIVGGVGEGECDEIVPWLLITIVNESSPVERSGAAQALAEVGTALGTARFGQIYAQVFQLHSSPSSASREGLMWFLTFLPPILMEEFSAYLKRSLQITLIGLSDESEGVREVSLRSGKVIVASVGKSFATDIIPILCESMFDEDSRIRHNSVSLIGDLLFLIGDTRGVSAQEALADENEYEDEDVQVPSDYKSVGARVLNTIKSHIGEEMTQDVLASLYISRSDTSVIVRQTALQVWKSVVFNSPKTLIEILPRFIHHIIPKLASSDPELRLVAGKAIGEVVKRQGNFILPTLIPHLRDGLKSDDESMRQGICLGLAEIVSAATKKQIEDYLETIIIAMQQALCDDSSDVRVQAARAFVVLTKNIQGAALEAIVPSLMDRLSSEMANGDINCAPALDSAAPVDVSNLSPSLRAMREIVQVRPREMLDYLVPRMTSSPISLISARVLHSVVDVSSNLIHHHFSTFISAFIRELTNFSSNNIDNECILEDYESNSAEVKRFIAVKEAAASVVGSCSDAGVIFIVQDLGKIVEHETSVSIRRWGCWLLEMFIKKSSADVTEYTTVLLRYVLSRATESDKKLLAAVSDAISAMFTKLTPDEMINHIDFIRTCLQSTASSSRYKVDPMLLKLAEAQSSAGGAAAPASAAQSLETYVLPLLTINKSIEPFMTVFIHGLMNASSTQLREASASGMGEIVKMCDPNVLKPFLIKSTGPLIRVAGDRHPSSLKSAIIETLIILLDKGGANLKAFAPQLQTTFVKSLQDPSRSTRVKACAALGKLMSITARVDPLLNEFCTLAMSVESVAIRASIFEALSVVLLGGGDKSTPPVAEKVISLIISHISDDEESVRSSAAACFLGIGTFVELPAMEKLINSLTQGFAVNSSSNWNVIAGKCLAVGSILQAGFARIEDVKDSQCIDEAFELIDVCFSSAFPNAKVAACQAVLAMVCAKPSPSTNAFVSRIFEVFSGLLSRCISDPNASSDLKKCAVTAVKKASKLHGLACLPFYKTLLPPVIATLGALDLSIKYISDRALLYAVGGPSLTNLPQVASSLDGESARNLRDYAKKILNKLAVDSDDEN